MRDAATEEATSDTANTQIVANFDAAARARATTAVCSALLAIYSVGEGVGFTVFLAADDDAVLEVFSG